MITRCESKRWKRCWERKKGAFLPRSDLCRATSHFPRNKLYLNGERSLSVHGAVPPHLPKTAPGGARARCPPPPRPAGPSPQVAGRPSPPSPAARRPPPPAPGREPSSSPRNAPPGRGSPFLPSFLPPPARPRRGQRSLCYPARRFPPRRGAARPGRPPHQQALHVDRRARVADHGLQLPLAALEHPRRRLQRLRREGSRRHLHRRLLAHPPPRLAAAGDRPPLPGRRGLSGVARRRAGAGPSAAERPGEGRGPRRAGPGRRGGSRGQRAAVGRLAAGRA